MYRFLIPLMLFVSLAYPQESQLDASPSLFSVLAAINAAGYDAALDSPSNHPLREQVRAEIARRKPSVLFDLQRFYKEHKQRSDLAELSQYVSFALSTTGPPDFKSTFRQNEIPPEVQRLAGFDDIMKRFHREAGIDDLWSKAQPALDQVIARYHEGVVRSVQEVNAYLRNAGTGYLGHRFQIFVDVLGAPNQIQFHRYKDDFFVVLTASPEPQLNDVRVGYLQFMLEPLAMKYSEALMKNRGLIDYAQGAPALAEHYKNDFLLLATKSLVKAVESRMARNGGAAMVEQALREGYVVAPHFAEQLAVYEKQEQSMRFYFPELISSIDLRKEERRLENIQFASEGAVRRAKPVAPAPPPQLTPAQKTLEEAESLYAARNLDQARESYRKLMQQTEEKPVHAKAYYGLARIAAFQKDPELAEKLFQKTLELDPEPQVKSWTYVYLGRLADAAGERDQAARHYRAALACEGASTAAREAAERGLKNSLKKE